MTEKNPKPAPKKEDNSFNEERRTKGNGSDRWQTGTSSGGSFKEEKKNKK